MSDVSLLGAAELAAIRTGAEQATSGPWQHGEHDSIYGKERAAAIAHRHPGGTTADANFIAAAQTDAYGSRDSSGHSRRHARAAALLRLPDGVFLHSRHRGGYPSGSATHWRAAQLIRAVQRVLTRL